jgi:hypothetical protein
MEISALSFVAISWRIVIGTAAIFCRKKLRLFLKARGEVSKEYIKLFIGLHKVSNTNLYS